MNLSYWLKLSGGLLLGICLAGAAQAQTATKSAPALTERVSSLASAPSKEKKMKAQSLDAPQAKVNQLLADMDAHRMDATYNMTEAIHHLRRLGVLYPLNTYDPEFPIIYATGDKMYDRQRVKDAMMARETRLKAHH